MNGLEVLNVMREATMLLKKCDVENFDTFSFEEMQNDENIYSINFDFKDFTDYGYISYEGKIKDDTVVLKKIDVHKNGKTIHTFLLYCGDKHDITIVGFANEEDLNACYKQIVEKETQYVLGIDLEKIEDFHPTSIVDKEFIEKEAYVKTMRTL